MGNKLPSLILTYLVFVLAFLMVPSIGLSQSAGDVAFTGFNGEGSASLDGFAVVLINSYSAGDEIHFNSQEWNGSDFAGAGGDFTWIAPAGGTSPGTVLVFEDVEDSPSVNLGSITADANMNLSSSGDIIYAYVGTDKDSPNTPFLGAIATDANLYNQPDGIEGTLENTGLTQAGNETILLPDNTDNAQYIGDRSGNTPNGYRTELNVINGEDATDDNWDIYNGGDIAPFPPFNDTNFTLVNPPTLAFTTSAANVAEGNGSVPLTVELVEASDDPVNVDVIFLSGSSTAGTGDIGSYTTQTVTFGSGDASETTQDVIITLTDDSDSEGEERAVFQLQNNTAGSIINPEEVTLTITDNETPSIVFNEINADPGNDANGDGSLDTDTDEFVELVNNSGRDIDISGWAYKDAGSASFTFPEGTVIGAGNAVVLFDNTGDTQPSGNFGAAYVFTDAEIGLNNSGELLTLRDADGNIVSSVDYPDAGNDQSINLDPDGTGTSYLDHSSFSGSGGVLSSPGTRVDGSTWGNGTYAIGIRGNAGWRFMASPTQNTTFDDLFSEIWTQGIPGSDAPAVASSSANIYGYTENGGGAYNVISSMNDNLAPGKGYLVFVYEDDDYRAPGIQGGFPKVVNTNQAENNSPLNVSVTADDNDDSGNIDNNEGYNLLGNPYGTDLSVTALLDALEAADPSVNNNIYVWDDSQGSGNGAYIMLEDGDLLAPFQAFFVRYTSPGVNASVDFIRNNLAQNEGAQFYERPQTNELESTLGFEIHMENGNKFDSYRVQFSEDGQTGEDRYDGYKLFSLNADAINFYSVVGNDILLAKNVLPVFSSLEEGEELRITLGYNVPENGDYIFNWDVPEQLPEDMELYLIDNETGRETNMRTGEGYSANIVNNGQESNTVNKSSPVLSTQAYTSENNGRFELKVVRSQQQEPEPEPMEKPVELSPNYPNPFNAQTQTQMDLNLRERMHVKATIWNIVGQKVATLYDGMMDAVQNYPLRWSVPANMPSGIYICKVEAGGTVITRKMTLVK